MDGHQAEDRSRRVASERFHPYTYEELVGRDQVNRDLSWLKDDSHLGTDDLPGVEVLAAEIVEDLKAALLEFEALADDRDQVAP